jgi:hypothetical protein
MDSSSHVRKYDHDWLAFLSGDLRAQDLDELSEPGTEEIAPDPHWTEKHLSNFGLVATTNDLYHAAEASAIKQARNDSHIEMANRMRESQEDKLSLSRDFVDGLESRAFFNGARQQKLESCVAVFLFGAILGAVVVELISWLS